MSKDIKSGRIRSTAAGILIITAYSMLTYDITQKIVLGVITDILSGVAVILIAVLMYPVFVSRANKTITVLYIISRIIEGLLMIAGGLLIPSPKLAGFRNVIYQSIHIYFFIIGAILFYTLLYRAKVIPRFIPVWGIIATALLFIITMIKLAGLEISVLDIFLIPLILNELFLAFWLIFKGFSRSFSEENTPGQAS